MLAVVDRQTDNVMKLGGYKEHTFLMYDDVEKQGSLAQMQVTRVAQSS